MDPYALARDAADALRERSGFDGYDVAVVLGSGWKEGSVALEGPRTVVATAELPGFLAPTVAGHRGEIVSLTYRERRVALLAGRVHLYEGHRPDQVVHPVRALVAAGATTVVLTNAAGGVDPTVAPGRVVVISDHVNLTGCSPLEGPAPPAGFGSRFVDLSDLYSAALRARLHDSVEGLAEGVYLGLRGPHYETPAEIEMARRLGASLVGMSTVLEAIAARHLGADVLGLSLVSNFAAGVAPGALDHREVLAAGERAAATLGGLLAAALAVA